MGQNEGRVGERIENERKGNREHKERGRERKEDGRKRKGKREDFENGRCGKVWKEGERNLYRNIVTFDGTCSAFLTVENISVPTCKC